MRSATYSSISTDPTASGGDPSRTISFSASDARQISTTVTTTVAFPPPGLNDFGWAQGWGSPNNPRMTTDVDGHGATDYVGFGFQSVFVAYGGIFSDGQGHLGHGFPPAVGSVNDFGTNEGYAATVPRRATAANSYLIPLGAGNNSGWKQSVDIRSFTDAAGKVIDLNGDGTADFVGMGPQGLVYADGNHNGPGGGYGLGPLQFAHVGAGGAPDLGEAQGWSNAATLRYIVADKLTGH